MSTFHIIVIFGRDGVTNGLGAYDDEYLKLRTGG